MKDSKGNIINFFLRIAEGLSHLHSNDIVHGDVRGDNILVGNDGLPRISDYGFSRILRTLNRIRSNTGAEIDVSDGAIRFMSIESLKHEEDYEKYHLTKPSDVWSFGMTMLELWSGRKPFYTSNDKRVSSKICLGQYPPFPPTASLVRPDFESSRTAVEFLCKLCWKKDPEDRPTIQTLVHMLW
ncbi:kinase-like domain-containing protein [Phellopilus nigrolimitatus]|nr:kinase-like domain-containing protein [Phellopilus nigrolimitatus]